MNASLKLVSTNSQASTALTNTQLATRISQFAANLNATCYWQLLDIAMFDTRRAWAEQGKLIFQGSLPADSGALFLKALNATVELLEKEQANVPAET